MTYNPTNWKAGDTVTSAKLNKMEQGIANSGMMILHIDEDGVLDKTWQEIYNAMPNVIIYADYGSAKISLIPFVVSSVNFEIKCIDPEAAAANTFAITTFSADSPNNYPIMLNNEEAGSLATS